MQIRFLKTVNTRTNTFREGKTFELPDGPDVQRWVARGKAEVVTAGNAEPAAVENAAPPAPAQQRKGRRPKSGAKGDQPGAETPTDAPAAESPAQA